MFQIRLLTRAPILAAGVLVAVLVPVATATRANASAHAAPTQRALPDSIADFGALVRGLSDSGGYFDTDNLISNERGYQQVLGAMDRLRVRGGAYIGVGPDQNFTYIATVRPRIAFMLDIRRDNMLQHLLFKALFARATNRAEYLALWTGRPLPENSAELSAKSLPALVSWIDATTATSASADRAKRSVRESIQQMGLALSAQDYATIARFHDQFIREGLSLRFTSTGRAPQSYYPTLRDLILEHDDSGKMRGYLALESDFRFLKSLQQRNLIVPVTGDLAGPKSLNAIGRFLAQNGGSVSTLYASNVEDYLIRDGSFPSYVRAVKSLPRDSNAVIIRSFFGGGFGHPEATAEYYATQLLQRMDAFVADEGVASVGRYRDLVVRNFVPRRAPARSRDNDAVDSYGPGQRVLLDAHNAYPERGQWTDRIDRALSAGLPLAIEQDLYWSKPSDGAPFVSVVAHDDDALSGAPTFKEHFFERIRPLVEQAIAENRRERWPLIVLNLDFKDNKPEHLQYVWALLGEYESWLTTAPRVSGSQPQVLETGPLLVLSGSDTAQRRVFFEDVQIGDKLRAFGAIKPVKVEGATSPQRAKRAVKMSADDHIAYSADNYARWVNFPWSVIEEGGQKNARGWTTADSSRLAAFVRRAHGQQLWIRFYTLDGFAKSDDRGYTASYNFGSADAARERWRAAIQAGVDFVATDQYGEFAAVKAAARHQ